MICDDETGRIFNVLPQRDPKNLAWATDLCSKHRDELGAVHLGVLAAHAMLGHVLLARSQGQNLGCLVSKPELKSDPRIFPIIAAAVPDDLRRLHVGLGMLKSLAKIHALAPGRILQACCRSDLPSNRFWAAAGFTPIAVRRTGSVRGKPLLIWRRCVDGLPRQLDIYNAPRRPRGGGGRWLAKGQEHMAETISFDPDDIATEVLRSKAVVGLPGWRRPSMQHADHDRPVDEIDGRPVDDLGR